MVKIHNIDFILVAKHGTFDKLPQQGKQWMKRMGLKSQPLSEEEHFMYCFLLHWWYSEVLQQLRSRPLTPHQAFNIPHI